MDSSRMTPFFIGNWFGYWMISSVLFSGLLCFNQTDAFLNNYVISHSIRDHISLPFSYSQNSPLLPRFSKLIQMRSEKKDKYQIKTLSPTYRPKNKNQQKYVDALQNKNTSMVVNIGPAGTGKTLFACHAAIQELRRGNIQKIILTRPVVSVDEEIGFLPGNLVTKMDPWTRPIFDILLEFYSQTDIDTMIRNGVIEISPLAFMRGRTFKRAFIIADEMQNSSPNQMLMLITRIGMESKMVITGDLNQSDRGVNNGLADFVKRLRHKKKKCDQVADLLFDFNMIPIIIFEYQV
jgi:phosphate starvation-inducible PhoH-like protein